MRTSKRNPEDFELDLTCKICGRPHAIKFETFGKSHIITHKNGNKSIMVEFPKYCKWCEMIAEQKEQGK